MKPTHSGQDLRRLRTARLLAPWLALALAACAVEVENLKPAREMAAQRDRPAGSVYLGWRVFQDRCARCHGPAAQGTAKAPDLTARMIEIGPRRFADLVLRRYDWEATMDARRDEAALQALVDEVMRSGGPVQVMPAWGGEPVVTAHILDLYAYLAARADGSQGAGRPAP